ncbi:unnamed protein product [Paramecium pentaurelia]|uniref:Uncharacterized protein n=1 Tax=Paramecium pentaurelia TaxID=43138 RepID=A0A8S1Y881_9CILI|nr:unnamed protein product [Paramecium pentaurelia]
MRSWIANLRQRKSSLRCNNEGFQIIKRRCKQFIQGIILFKDKNKKSKENLTQMMDSKKRKSEVTNRFQPEREVIEKEAELQFNYNQLLKKYNFQKDSKKLVTDLSCIIM